VTCSKLGKKSKGLIAIKDPSPAVTIIIPVQSATTSVQAVVAKSIPVFDMINLDGPLPQYETSRRIRAEISDLDKRRTYPEANGQQ